MFSFKTKILFKIKYFSTKTKSGKGIGIEKRNLPSSNGQEWPW